MQQMQQVKKSGQWEGNVECEMWNVESTDPRITNHAIQPYALSPDSA